MGIQVAALLLTAGNTAYQYQENKRQRNIQREATEVQAATETIEARRIQRAEARKARIRRAQIEQAAIASGTSGSSGESGAMSGIGVYQGTNQANLGFNKLTANTMSSLNQRMADSQYRAQIANAVTGLATQSLGLFKKPSTTTANDPSSDFDIDFDPFETNF